MALCLSLLKHIQSQSNYLLGMIFVKKSLRGRCHMKKISIFITILIIGLLMNPLNAFAKAKLNAQCTFQDSKLNGLNHQDKKFPLASVSKLATTYWALKVLGPQFRYQTIIHIYNRSGNKAEIHIEGGKDPFFGRETSYFLVSELNKMGITQVENLTFDENFKIFWGVRSYDLHIQGRRTEYYYETNEGTRNNIIEVMHDNPINAKYYALTRDKAKSWFGVKMLQKVQFHAKHVQFKSRQDFNNSAANTDAFILKSAPLYRYLKEMNLVSHNYVADMIYAGISNEILGDRSFNAIRYQASVDFEKFLHHDLGLTSKDIDFVNGSGNSEFLEGTKVYNKGSCESIIKIIIAMKDLLNQNDLTLKDVMAVSGSDASTLGKRYAGFPNAVVAKTGTVNPAIALAGVINTGKGLIYFAYLMKTDGPGDYNRARNMIAANIKALFKKNSGIEKLDYTPRRFLPFDEKSTLKPEEPEFDPQNKDTMVDDNEKEIDVESTGELELNDAIELGPIN